MYYGIPVWMFKREPDYEQTMQTIAALGFKGVELIAWSRQELDEYYTPETASALKALAASLGLQITNFNHTPKCITSPDEDLRAARIADFKRAIDVAVNLGVQNVTMVSQYPFGEPYAGFMDLRRIAELQQWSYDHFDLNRDWEANFALYADTMRALCGYAAERGARVLVEPHPYRLINSSASMLRLIERVGCDNLGINYDPSHLFPQGDMPEWAVHMLRGRLWHTHFSDNDTLTNVHWRPGQGKINWRAVMQALRDIGYDGAINFELEDVPGAPTPATAAQGPSEAMITELLEARKYIDGVCAAIDLRVE
ncbi:MAG: sugar phosphate isomerase/epimerase [Oscillospiraceae bacterium]|jgi:sugar phosphate isomerase/epimerase|nr:sugar phosphate isomerase/epimerase [Oscillospiraceae bacterium]